MCPLVPPWSARDVFLRATVPVAVRLSPCGSEVCVSVLLWPFGLFTLSRARVRIVSPPHGRWCVRVWPHRGKIMKVFDAFCGVSILSLYFVYLLVVKSLLSAWDCTQNAGGAWILNADPAVNCNQVRHMH